MTSSTVSTVNPAWICFMAAPAFFIASSVSLLMLAVSIEYISRSRVMICDEVCSRVCSNCFFRRRAAFAAVGQGQNRPFASAVQTIHTVFIGRHIFPRKVILLIHLVLQMFFSLVQHFQLASELQDGFLRSVLVLLSSPAQPT